MNFIASLKANDTIYIEEIHEGSEPRYSKLIETTVTKIDAKYIHVEIHDHDIIFKRKPPYEQPYPYHPVHGGNKYKHYYELYFTREQYELECEARRKKIKSINQVAEFFGSIQNIRNLTQGQLDIITNIISNS